MNKARLALPHWVGGVAALFAICGALLLWSSSPALADGAQATSGVSEDIIKVPVGPDGKTSEQTLTERRLKQDNSAGAVKFAYVGSAYTGELLFQSVVEMKVVSSDKRLSPQSVYTWKVKHGHDGGIPLNIGAEVYYTSELLQDDGTYGESVPYLFWWDVDKTYFQYFVTDDNFVVVTSRPVDFSKIRWQVVDMIKTDREALAKADSTAKK